MRGQAGRPGWHWSEQPDVRRGGALDCPHRLSVARSSEHFRQMEQCVRALQPLEPRWCLAAHLRGTRRRSRLRISDRRLHHRAGTPACGWRKRGTQNQAIGRSRGGLTSKIYLAVRGLGLPVRCLLTAGQRHDVTQAKALIDGLPAEWVLGDSAFDADHFRADIEAIKAKAAIPSNPSRALKPPFDKHIYKERHLVECCINKLKQFRRVATRYEKTARNFLAIVTVAAIALWLR